MHATCIRILPPSCYERMKYNIYIHHDIMQALFCSVVSDVVYYVVPDQGRPRGTYTSPPGGSMCAYMGRV